MWRIIQTLSRFGNAILFVVLQLSALLLIINLNNTHKRVSQSFFLQVSAAVSSVNTQITNYFSLGRENEKLMEENIHLREQLLALENEVTLYQNRVPYQPGFIHLPDSLLPLQGFEFIPALAINNSINRNYNYITLNKGSKHGVGRGMGVVSPDGISGMIIESSENYSLAISILNKKFSLSCRMMHNQNIGPLTWDGRDPDYAWLEDIPLTSAIIIGDTVVTSGYSTIFPAGMQVGFVESYDNNVQEGFYRVKVELATNFRGLRNLYVVKHKHQAEIEVLEANQKEN